MFTLTRDITRPDESAPFWVELPHTNLVEIMDLAISQGHLLSVDTIPIDSLHVQHIITAPSYEEILVFSNMILSVYPDTLSEESAYNTLHGHTQVVHTTNT